MIMTIAMIYIFLSYMIFNQQMKITFRKFLGSPQKNPLPLFYSLPPISPSSPENSKSSSSPYKKRARER